MTTILIKKKDTAGAPAAGDLTNAAGGTEIAVNTATRRIYTKDSGGNVVELGTNASASTIADLTVTTSTTLSYGTANQVQYLNASKLLVGSASMVFNGTRLTVADLADSGLTSGRVVYASTGGALVDSSALTFDGAILGVNGVSVGRGAGAVSTNTAVGASALAANTAGTYTVAIGNEALKANTTGDQNTAVGGYTLIKNTTGTYNTAVGVNSVWSNTTGSNNTGLGHGSLASNTTASWNTAVGYQAGYNNTTGLITAFGSQALNSNTTGTNNVAVGGYTSGTNYAALTFNTSGSNNTAVGNGALQANTTASNNTAVGYQAGYSNTTGGSNASLGYQALYANTTGQLNVAIGSQALYAQSADAYNTAVGANSMQSTTTGQLNAALGRLSLNANTTGSNNVALGYSALQSNTTASRNTAVGYQAGYLNTTGFANLFAGYASGQVVTTGTGNTMVGDSAGILATTGSFNTFVGQASGSSVTTGTKNTIVGTYNGNQDSLDIRTANNNIVLSDGDGNARGYFDSTGTFYVRRASNGVHVQTTVAGANSAALGSFNGAPTVGSNATGYSGIMFNGAAYEPTLDGLNVRQSALVDIGSTGFRYKIGHFTGINFPATQSASSNANTLDDYEEGTFTPFSEGITTAGTGTYSIQIGRYTKIGNSVYFTIILAWSAHTGTGGINIGGLPFNQLSVVGERFSYSIVAESLTYSGQLVTLNSGANTLVTLFQQASGASLSTVPMDTNVSYLVITGTYNV